MSRARKKIRKIIVNKINNININDDKPHEYERSLWFKEDIEELLNYYIRAQAESSEKENICL